MFEKTEIRRSKKKLMVRLTLANGDIVDGDIFVARDERLTDLLNDDRAFIPVEMTEGRVMALAKSTITSAAIVAEQAPLSDEPHKILRVEPAASDAEVRQAWMARLKACHPDRLAALGLDDEIVVTARRVAQEINAAYDDIMSERRARAKSAA
ncbi:hypothetical protein [Parvularcula sp. LCG005]|uniref:J domain-containing protein n=1 Tax=Parvularcula sp. LCG005 TaxID=3078805 RepID=UPI00294260F0|nr:hypothetical protein [Parvularcula sp. LCG005]WOI53973.1 hypothetical protein RUI03_02965 [Parvularcula sp. LCG005]